MREKSVDCSFMGSFLARKREFDTHLWQLYHPRAMGQRANNRPAVWIFVLLALLLSAGSCDRNKSTSTPAPARTADHKIKIASLVPAATDLIVGMGAADHLVAVSNWDTDRPEIKQLPRVGDYQTIDWDRSCRNRIAPTRYRRRFIRNWMRFPGASPDNPRSPPCSRAMRPVMP